MRNKYQPQLCHSDVVMTEIVFIFFSSQWFYAVSGITWNCKSNALFKHFLL